MSLSMPLFLTEYLTIVCPPHFISYESRESPKEINRYMKIYSVLEQKYIAPKFCINQKLYGISELASKLFLLLALYKYICLILCIYFINLILKSHQRLNFL